MNQSIASVEASASTALSSLPSSPSPRSGEGAGRSEQSRSEFAAHLRQAGREASDARTPRSVRAGAPAGSGVSHAGSERTDRATSDDPGAAADGTHKESDAVGAVAFHPLSGDGSTPVDPAIAQPVATSLPAVPAAPTGAAAEVAAVTAAAPMAAAPTTAGPTAAGPTAAQDIVAGQAAVNGAAPAGGSPANVLAGPALATTTGAGTGLDSRVPSPPKPARPGFGPAPASATDPSALAPAAGSTTIGTIDASLAQLPPTATAEAAGGAHAAAPMSAGHQDVGVPTVSGVSAAASATTAAAPAPTTTAPQTSVAGQLAASLRTLAGRDDGVHVMTVRLHPDDLGPVRIVARLTGTDVHLRVTTTTAAAAAAVTEATPRLHDALAGGGLTTTGLDVDHDSDWSGQQFGLGGRPSADGREGARSGAGSGRSHPAPHWGGSVGGVDIPLAPPPARHPTARSLDLHV